jgi:hypothetical protein
MTRPQLATQRPIIHISSRLVAQGSHALPEYDVILAMAQQTQTLFLRKEPRVHFRS